MKGSLPRCTDIRPGPRGRSAAASRDALASGHTISYVTPSGGSLCTLGFAFRRAGRALSITAGHCVRDGSGYIIDTDSGYRGRVVSYAYDLSKKGSDFALIDFGNAPVDTTLLDTTIAAVEGPPTDQTICHTGRSTGSTCGQLAYHHRWGAQYLTEGHGDSAGDSGGPVWTRHGLDKRPSSGSGSEPMSRATTPSTAGSTR